MFTPSAEILINIMNRLLSETLYLFIFYQSGSMA